MCWLTSGYDVVSGFHLRHKQHGRERRDDQRCHDADWMQVAVTNWRKKSSDHVAPKVSDLKAIPRRAKEQTRQRRAHATDRWEAKQDAVQRKQKPQPRAAASSGSLAGASLTSSCGSLYRLGVPTALDSDRAISGLHRLVVIARGVTLVSARFNFRSPAATFAPSPRVDTACAAPQGYPAAHAPG